MSHDASGGMQVWWSEHWYLFPLLNAAERSIVSTLAQRFCERTTFLFSPGIERREELMWHRDSGHRGMDEGVPDEVVLVMTENDSMQKFYVYVL